MTPLRQVPHLIRRDLRQNRLLVAVLALGVLVGMEFLPPLPSFMPRFLAGLGAGVIWAIFAVQVIQADPVRGRRAGWRTLPVSGWALFWSKCILIVPGWLAVRVAAQAPWLVGIEVVWTDLAIPIRTALPWLILVVVLALVTPNLKVFATLCTFCLMGIAVVQSVSLGDYRETTEVVPVELSERATAALAAEHHLRVGGYRVGTRPAGDRDATTELQLHFAAEPDPIAHLLVGLKVERYLASGDTVRGERTDGVWPIGSSALPVGDSVRWLGPTGTSHSPDSVALMVLMDGPVQGVRTSPEPGSTGRIRARVEALQPTPILTIALTDTEVRTPRRRWQMLEATAGPDGPEVRIRLIEAPGTALPIERFPWNRDRAHRGETAWVLYNPHRSEALILGNRARATRGDSEVGSIQDLFLSPSQQHLSARGGPAAFFDVPPSLAVDPEWLVGAELHLFEWRSLGVQELVLRF